MLSQLTSYPLLSILFLNLVILRLTWSQGYILLLILSKPFQKIFGANLSKSTLCFLSFLLNSLIIQKSLLIWCQFHTLINRIDYLLRLRGLHRLHSQSLYLLLFVYHLRNIYRFLILLNSIWGSLIINKCKIYRVIIITLNL